MEGSRCFEKEQPTWGWNPECGRRKWREARQLCFHSPPVCHCSRGGLRQVPAWFLSSRNIELLDRRLNFFQFHSKIASIWVERVGTRTKKGISLRTYFQRRRDFGKDRILDHKGRWWCWGWKDVDLSLFLEIFWSHLDEAQEQKLWEQHWPGRGEDPCLPEQTRSHTGTSYGKEIKSKDSIKGQKKSKMRLVAYLFFSSRTRCWFWLHISPL